MSTKIITCIFFIAAGLFLGIGASGAYYTDTVTVANNSFTVTIPTEPSEPVAPIIAPRMMSVTPEPTVVEPDIVPESTPQVLITPDTSFTISSPEPQVEQIVVPAVPELSIPSTEPDNTTENPAP